MVMLYGILQSHSVYLQVSFINILFIKRRAIFLCFFWDCDKANMEEQQQQLFNYKSQENFQIGEIAENSVKKKIIRKFISGQYFHDNQ
jgi:hypothetical protein